MKLKLPHIISLLIHILISLDLAAHESYLNGKNFNIVNNVVSWSSEHCTFKLAGTRFNKTSSVTTIYKDNSYSLTWDAMQGTGIKITKCEIKVGNPSLSSFDLTINNSTFSVRGWQTEKGYSIDNLNLGNDGIINIKVSGNCDIYRITLTYEVILSLDPSEGLQASIKTYDHVTLNRTISTGLSTIALPFSTTVEALTGRASDKAYTLCNVGYRQGEGYTFYFKEVEGGVLQAGKPYVISAASEVVNPQWGQTTIGELTAGEITCGAWSFKANFEAGKSMEGLYGVVNSQNKVMKGGAGSTLNAFSAYFELAPAAASTAVSTKASAAEDIPAGAIPLFTIPVK